jgi:glycosyltransferase involved in cell wall biosynthesis
MVEVKCVDVLLRAFQQFQQLTAEAHLYLAGQGPLKLQLQTLAQDLGVSAQVHFVGPVSQSDLPAWYQAADATVLTSRSEGLPNVLRESLACGTPIVSTDVGSVREIAEPTSSILVQVDDPSSTANAMRDILDPVYQTGAANFQPQSWDQTARNMIRLFYRVGKLSTGTASHTSGTREDVAV